MISKVSEQKFQRIMKFFILVIFLGILAVDAVEFDCKFKDSYRCEVISGTIYTRNDAYVTGIRGSHQGSKTNRDVLGFDARNVNLKYFPRNLNLYLPSVTEIFVEQGLREITKEDLQQYPKLSWLYLSNNEIKIIKKDTFMYNPDLKLVFLGGNKIKHVDPNVFDHLDNLIFLGFENICHSGLAENDRTGVVNLINNIKQKCSQNNPESKVINRKKSGRYRSF